jgi:hypothetical protein
MGHLSQHEGLEFYEAKGYFCDLILADETEMSGEDLK